MGEENAEPGQNEDGVPVTKSQPAAAPAPPPRGPRHRGPVRRWSMRILKCGFAIVALYALIVLVGLIPVNNDFVESDDGIEIFIASTMVHADVIVPVKTEVFNWREEFSARDFEGSVRTMTHVAIGWGDRGFFLDCPTWDDVTASTVGSALFWPSGSLCHVTFAKPNWFEDLRSVRISKEQYRRLVEVVRAQFLRDELGRVQPVAGEHYLYTDAFYEAKGRYHVLNTCNSWIGEILRESGVRAPWLTPLPKSMFLYLPAEE